MDIEQLERRLDTWKHWLLLATGASVTFFVTSVVNVPRYDDYGWYYVFITLWLTLTPAGFILLMGKKWRAVPLTKRLNVAYGYLGCAWMVLLSIVGVSNGDTLCISFIVLAVLILGSTYIYLRKKKDAPEQMFP